MKILSLRTLLVAAVALVAGCNKPTVTVTGTGALDALAADTVVAQVGSTKITLKEVDQTAGAELADLEKKKFDLRRGALDQMIVQSLVKAEATKAGKTEEEFLRAEVDSKIAPPADADIQKVFDENKSKMPPDSTLEKMKPQIIAFMTNDQRRELAMKLFDELKKKANVQVMLKEPPKQRVVVEATGPSKGPNDARVTIVEFSDFQCPFCSRAVGTVDRVMQEYAGKVRLVFRQFPLDFHPMAPKAAEAALCAAEQGKFWEMHDTMFQNQQKLMPDDLKAHAKTLALDTKKFDECLTSGKMAATVSKDMEAGKKAGVNGTPAFFINGVMLSGAQPFEEFKRAIDGELSPN